MLITTTFGAVSGGGYDTNQLSTATASTSDIPFAVGELCKRVQFAVQKLRGNQSSSGGGADSQEQQINYNANNNGGGGGQMDMLLAIEILNAPDKRKLLKLRPTRLLGVGSESIVFSSADGSTALKYSPPSLDPRFEPQHEYKMLQCWGMAGLAFCPIDFIAHESKKNQQRQWKTGINGAKLLECPGNSKILKAAFRDLVSVIVMEAAEGTLGKYISSASHPQPPETVGAALVHLLYASRRRQAAHNDAKVDNIGFKVGGPPLASHCPIFRFVDCRTSITKEYLVSSNKSNGRDERVLLNVIDAACRRDALCLCDSLLKLSRSLPKERALYARQVASRIWPLGWKLSNTNIPPMSINSCVAEARRLWKRVNACLPPARPLEEASVV